MQKSKLAFLGVTSAVSLALFGWGAVAGTQEVMGIISIADHAQIIVADQPDAQGYITVAKVIAPRDSFVVVHQSDGGMPGKRLGYTAVPKGVSRNVKVKLDPSVPLTPKLLAAVHADTGVKGKFEFDMKNIETTPDKPFNVDGKEVATEFKAADFGIPARMDQASIQAGDQPLGDTVKIAKAVAPADAFVVVHKAKADGMPGERVGFAAIKAGESDNVEVKLTKKLLGRTKLLAAIHVDRGVAGKLEFDMNAPVDSPDQPFFADDMEVATAFEVGPFGIKTSGASIEATDQVGATDSITIAKVNAPGDAWLVVHKDAGGAPGERVGLLRIKAGESTDVKVPIHAEKLSGQLFVAVHADRGVAEKFDFDMNDKLGSADQPYFVDGKEVATAIKVRSFGYPDETATAKIAASPQVVQNGLLKVDLAAAPEPAWIVVHLDAGGGPGARVGLLHIPAGTTRNAVVQLDASKMLTDQVFVAVHADRGTAGFFDFDMMDKVNSADQPFFVNGAEVATAVTVR